MPSRSWGSYGFPLARRHDAAAASASDGMSDSDMEVHHVKRPTFLSQRVSRSRSSSPCGSSPRTPGSWESSPRASTSSTDSHWSFPSPKGFSFTKSIGNRCRLGFSKRSGRSKHQGAEDSEAESSSPRSPRMLPMMVDRLPSDEDERESYMTVIVGERTANMQTYVINKHLLTHHLVQTLMKCSEDMAGPPEFRRNSLFPIVCCDPALFVSLVQRVGADLIADLE